MRERTEESGGGKRRPIGVGGFRISATARDLVMQVLASERLTAGPMMTRFENAVAEAHDCRFALMCNSGTSALQMALAALKEVHGWEDGDEVLVPAVTFVATANVVLYNNLRPVFVDVEPRYYTMDPGQMEARITARTRAVIPVHLAGLPCDMDPILAVARAHRLRVVEDACEAMFARYKGRPVGSFGDVGCFSTYAAHVITTGVGGLCTTNDANLLVVLKSVMNHGRDASYVRIDDDQGVQGEALFRIVDRRFSFVRLGHSFRATEMEAALGIAQFEGRDADRARRLEIAKRLTGALLDLREALQLPRPRAEADHGYMMYPLVLRRSEANRSELVRYLEEHGIETRYLLPLINQPVYRKLFGNLDDQYPVAAWLNRAAFYVGCHPAMSDEDVEYVGNCFRTYFGGG